MTALLSKILLALALLMLVLKFGLAFKTGLRARLRELGRALDRFVNIALVVIIFAYAVQLAILFAKQR